MSTAAQRVAAVIAPLPLRREILFRVAPSVVRVPADPAGLVEFGRRDPALHRVIDSTKRNLPAPEVPAAIETTKSVAEKIKDSPAARSLARRLLKVGVGAGAGAYLGHRAHGRPGLKAGAKAGAVAGLMFERKNSMDTNSHGGARVALSQTEVAKLIGVPVSALPALMRAGVVQPTNELIRGNHDGPAVYFMADLVAARCAVEATAGEQPVEFATFIREEKKTLTDRAVAAAKVIGTGAAVAGGAAWLRGRIGAGASRAGALGVAKTAILGGRMLRKDAVNLTNPLTRLLLRAKAARSAA